MEEMVVLVGTRMNYDKNGKGNNWDNTNKASMEHLHKLVRAEDEYMDR